VDVVHEPPAIDIGQIEIHHVLKVIDAVSPRHLPQPGDSGLHGDAPALPGLVQLHLVRRRRARADQAHVAAEHIDELRKLVQGGLAQNPPHPRDARVVLHLEHAALHLVVAHQLPLARLGVDEHGPELVQGEMTVVAAHAGLPEKHRPRRIEPDGQGHQGQLQEQDREPRDAAHDVQDALVEEARRTDARAVHGQGRHVAHVLHRQPAHHLVRVEHAGHDAGRDAQHPAALDLFAQLDRRFGRQGKDDLVELVPEQHVAQAVMAAKVSHALYLAHLPIRQPARHPVPVALLRLQGLSHRQHAIPAADQQHPLHLGAPADAFAHEAGDHHADHEQPAEDDPPVDRDVPAADALGLDHEDAQGQHGEIDDHGQAHLAQAFEAAHREALAVKTEAAHHEAVQEHEHEHHGHEDPVRHAEISPGQFPADMPRPVRARDDHQAVGEQQQVGDDEDLVLEHDPAP